MKQQEIKKAQIEILDKYNSFLGKINLKDDSTRNEVYNQFKKENGLIDYELGKVYKNDVIIFLLTSIDDDRMLGYGLTLDGKEYYKPNTPITDITDDLLVEATPKEWEERLKDYAINEKGFKEGVEFDCLNGNNDCFIEGDGFCLLSNKCLTYENKAIMKYGVWAKIIEQPKADIKEENGNTVITIPKGVEFEFKTK